MAYSGYHGETEGSADEAKEWPPGSGFSHPWGTAQVLHSSAANSQVGASPRTLLRWRSCLTQKFVPALGDLLLIQIDIGLQRPDPLALRVRGIFEGPPQPQNSLWDWLKPVFSAPSHTSNVTLCSGVLLLLVYRYWSKRALRSICKSQSHFPGENNPMPLYSMCCCSLSFWEESSTLKCSLKDIDILSPGDLLSLVSALLAGPSILSTYPSRTFLSPNCNWIVLNYAKLGKPLQKFILVLLQR